MNIKAELDGREREFEVMPSGTGATHILRKDGIEALIRGYMYHVVCLRLICPLHAAAEQTTGVLIQLIQYVQQELIPNVREIEGGQEVLDQGWAYITLGHAAIAAAKEAP